MTIEELKALPLTQVSDYTLTNCYGTEWATPVKWLYVILLTNRTMDGQPTNKMRVIYAYKGNRYKRMQDVLDAINKDEDVR
jgi:hypothetical protein